MPEAPAVTLPRYTDFWQNATTQEGTPKKSSVRDYTRQHAAEQAPGHTQPASRHAVTVAADEVNNEQHNISCPAAHTHTQVS